MKNWIPIIILGVCLTNAADAQVSPMGGGEFGYKAKINATITQVNTNTADIAALETSDSINLEYSISTTGIYLAYDAQSVDYTVGATVVGGTSGTMGIILADTDGGASGLLKLDFVTGDFEDGETLTDGSGGSATVDGAAEVWGPLAADDSANGPVYSGYVAGETVAQWEPLYLAADGKLWLTDSTNATTADVYGYAYAASTADSPISIVKDCEVRNDAWDWTPGGELYAYEGALTQTLPTTAGHTYEPAGRALSADIASITTTQARERVAAP